MARYQTINVISKRIWENFLLSKNPKSFLQSWNWAETNALMGDKVFRLGFVKNNKLVGICLLIKQDAKRGPHLLIPGGPIMDWKDKRVVQLFLKSVTGLAKQEGVWFARVRPEITESAEARRMFSQLGFYPSPMHLNAENTWVLKIDRSEEELLSGMRKTTRYLIRRSLKEGYHLERTVDLSKVGTLYNLQKETVERHKFVGFPKSLFTHQMETFGNDDQAELYLCKRRNKVLAAAIIIYYGDTAYYHHSGSTSRYPKLSFSYFLQWQIMLEAKRRGLKYYNFWGVSSDGNPKHRFAGVTIFKKGFGGEQVNWLHAHDLPIYPLYWCTHFFELIRKRLRRL